jgi:hypothetical protein
MAELCLQKLNLFTRQQDYISELAYHQFLERLPGTEGCLQVLSQKISEGVIVGRKDPGDSENYSRINK